jgi:hypothetical protein
VRVNTSFFNILSCIINRTDVDWRQFQHFTSIDWGCFYAKSKQQGVVAIVFDKINEIPKEIAPPKDVLLKWYTQSLSIESQQKAKDAISIELSEKLYRRGIETVILKGLAYASYYPNPYHRESGDVDCYLMGKKDEGDRVVKELGCEIRGAGYKHSHIHYKGLIFENHKYITSFDNTKLGIKTERILQTLITEGCKPIWNTKLLCPSADFNAIFLVKHAQRHFLKEGIRIRHLLDWAFFLKAEASNINWKKVLPIMEECRILNFAKVLTSMCVEKLGLKIDVKELICTDKLTEKVVDDILGDQPGIYNESGVQKIRRMFRRLYRMWKFRSLADESFIRLVWNNLIFCSYFRRYINFNMNLCK